MRALMMSCLFGLAAALFPHLTRAETIEISAECHWYAQAECQARCDELSFYSACEVDIDGQCAGSCSGFDIDVDCKSDCELNCQTTYCDVDPGSFECNAYCRGKCGASCEGQCAATDDAAYCQGECDAFCEGECEAGCSGTPPSIDCQGGCEASCEGSCQAEVDFDCHMDCEIEAYADCETDISLDCDLACDSDGILECNGDYIGQNDLEAAIAWVKNNTNFDITYEGDAECVDNSCHAEGSASITCGVAPGKTRSLFGILARLYS